jgi:RNA polymerase-binding transcription factor DksA
MQYPLDYQLTLARVIRERFAGDPAALQEALTRLRRADYGACFGCGKVMPYFDMLSDPAARYCPGCSSAASDGQASCRPGR